MTCEVCGERYADFRTGLTFADVRRSMFVASDDPADWRYKTRRMVLGHWHEIKLLQWRERHAMCEQWQTS